jgi:membrane associated rhomboid family serine protease
MPWITVAIGVLALLVGAAAIYVRRTRQGLRPREESRFAQGLAIGMGTAVAIGILLSELGGYQGAMSYAVVAGMAGGSILGFLLDRRHRRQRRRDAYLDRGKL